MATKHSKLTVERVRSALDYDPETGIFRWKISLGKAKAGNIAGNIGPDGYWFVTIDRVLCSAARLAFFYIHGRWPEQIDHINRIRTDNRLSNLREATLLGNLRNRRTQKNNRSGYKGVHKWKRGWRAVIMVNYKQRLIGQFHTPAEAASAYDSAARELFGEFAFLNFPK